MVAVFPYLPAVTFPVMRSIGLFDTTTQTSVSGKKTYFANKTQATYKYTLEVTALDSLGTNAALIANSQQLLLGFYNQQLGSALIFNYWDVDDNLATTQEFGVGDGATTAFQLARAIGGWADNIFAPLNSGCSATRWSSRTPPATRRWRRRTSPPARPARSAGSARRSRASKRAPRRPLPA